MQTTNTFIPAFGNKPRQIIGRSEIINDFTEGLSLPVGNRQRAMLLIGQRGTGKTALLLSFEEIAQKLGFITARVAANDEMLDEIIQTIQINGSKHIKPPKKKVSGISAGALGFSFGLTFTEEAEKTLGFRARLTLLCDELAKINKGILILVDEVQSSNPQMRQLATTYQHLVGESKNIAISMAGLPGSMSAVLNDSILTFLNRAYKSHLESLPINEVSVNYAMEFEKQGKAIAHEEVVMAATATRGYPYLYQLIGYYVLAFSANSEVITPQIVSLAINSSKRDLEDSVFSAALKPLSAGDMKFLHAMARDSEHSMIKDIAARLNVSAPHAQKYRTRLIESGIIAPVRRGELAFELPFLGDYLRGEL